MSVYRATLLLTLTWYHTLPGKARIKIIAAASLCQNYISCRHGYLPSHEVHMFPISRALWSAVTWQLPCCGG